MTDVIPYSKQVIDDDDKLAVLQVLDSPFLTQGPEVPAFERAIADMHEMPHGIAVSNATAGLHIACLALKVGVGDLVWTSPISFVASANCARYCGATVDFVDIDPATRNMSVAALREKLEAGRRKGVLPKVVIPVDFSGLPCDMAEIRSLADDYGFAIVSDASHAVGASYRGGPIGSLADITVFSFHPVKIITTGEGGLCLTADEKLAERLQLLRSHGVTRDEKLMQGESEGGWYYEQVALGFNYRLTDMAAALGRAQLKKHANHAAARERLATRYDKLLSPLPLKLPARLPDRQSAHHLYVIELQEGGAQERLALFDHLRDRGIGANVHYIPIHLQPDFRRLGFEPGDFPHAERYYDRAVTIPLYPTLTDDEQDFVVSCLASWLG